MDRKKILKEEIELARAFDLFQKLYNKLGSAFLKDLNRLPSLPDIFIDRWERAKLLGFGEGSNIYDSSLVIGNVRVGKECWIGPQTVLDGSGGLVIGDYCTISAGVQIYSHDNVKQTLSSKKHPIDQSPTSLGNNVYVAPNVVISKGVRIGNECILATGSFVNKSFPDRTVIMGQPGRAVGRVEITDNEINILYG